MIKVLLILFFESDSNVEHTSVYTFLCAEHTENRVVLMMRYPNVMNSLFNRT